ncbi:MAG: hypothetical protein J5996_03895 [Prevotella sp.]|nr:hypothetical protein [Prevotella sp.]
MNKEITTRRPLLVVLGIFLLVLGTVPYILWHQDVVFLNSIRDWLPCLPAHSHSWLNDFLIYNFPDGAWLLSLLLIQRYIGTLKIFELCAIALAIILELGQYLGWISGTFDLLDLLTYIIIFILFKLCTTKLKSH